MKSRSSSVGALHPILFVAVMYVVVLFLSIFICSSIFYTLNDDTASNADNTSQAAVQKKTTPAHMATAVVVR
ncbi:MAG: hypothetical protein KA821_04250 [Chitinophagaceae bacterium]|nr:hypothetical protein [Chitinophagaceae bacterium]